MLLVGGRGKTAAIAVTGPEPWEKGRCGEVSRAEERRREEKETQPSSLPPSMGTKSDPKIKQGK